VNVTFVIKHSLTKVDYKPTCIGTLNEKCLNAMFVRGFLKVSVVSYNINSLMVRTSQRKPLQKALNLVLETF
jgi:hypothetical protein